MTVNIVLAKISTVSRFVCAVGSSDIGHAAGPTLFRTYEVTKNGSYNCKIWEAARATTAAPTFFKRIKIGSLASGVEYVDAGRWSRLQ